MILGSLLVQYSVISRFGSIKLCCSFKAFYRFHKIPFFGGWEAVVALII